MVQHNPWNAVRDLVNHTIVILLTDMTWRTALISPSLPPWPFCSTYSVPDWHTALFVGWKTELSPQWLPLVEGSYVGGGLYLSKKKNIFIHFFIGQPDTLSKVRFRRLNMTNMTDKICFQDTSRDVEGTSHFTARLPLWYPPLPCMSPYVSPYGFFVILNFAVLDRDVP